MISQIKSLAKQTLIYGAGNILTRFVTFLLLPLFTNILTPEEFGLATLLFVFLGFMNIVYRYGLDSAFMRTFRDAKDAEDEKQFFSTAIWLSLGTGVLLSLIIFSFSENLASYLLQNSQYTNLLMIAAGILVLDGLAHVPFALLRMKEKASLFISIKFINVVTTLGLNIYFLAILRMGVTGIFLSAFIAALVTDIFVFITAITQIRFKFSSTVAKDYLKFGLPFIPAGLASIVMEAIDRYIITYLKDTATVGIYSAGYKLGIFMLLITTAFNYAWQPFFLKIGKSEEARPLFARVFTYFTLVTLFVWVVLSAFIHEIIRVRIGGYSIIGSSFYESESIVPLILLAYVFQGAYLNFLPGIYFDKKTYYIPVITACGALVNVTLNFILIPLYGMMGAAIATLIGYGVMAIITLPISRRLFHVPYEWSKILKIAFCAAGAMAIIYLLGETIVIKLLGIAIFVAAIFILNIVPTNEMIKFTQSFRSSSSGNSKNDSHSQEN